MPDNISKNTYSLSIRNKISRSGMVETICVFGSSLIGRMRSFIYIAVMRLRGYDIHETVSVGNRVTLFQSQRQSMRIGKDVIIGNGVRLKAGFYGKIQIGNGVLIEDNVSVFAHKTLSIGDNTMISAGCFITDFNHKFPHSRYKHLLLSEEGYTAKTTTIGKNVWIGANCSILSGVEIGNDAVIGAGSVVTKSIPSYSVAVGNPARVIKHIPKPE